MTPTQLLRGIGWAELREQKVWLLLSDASEADGLVCLIDAIQDCALDCDIATEEEVFGN